MVTMSAKHAGDSLPTTYVHTVSKFEMSGFSGEGSAISE